MRHSPLEFEDVKSEKVTIRITVELLEQLKAEGKRLGGKGKSRSASTIAGKIIERYFQELSK